MAYWSLVGLRVLMEGHVMVETTCPARDVNPIEAEKRTAKAGLKGFQQASGSMERNRPEADCDCERSVGGQVRLQSES